MTSEELDMIVAEANTAIEDTCAAHGIARPTPLSRGQVRAVVLAMQQLGLGANAPRRTITNRVTVEQTIEEPISLMSRAMRLLGGG